LIPTLLWLVVNTHFSKKLKKKALGLRSRRMIPEGKLNTVKWGLRLPGITTEAPKTVAAILSPVAPVTRQANRGGIVAKTG
jgi:hypothetical protein